MIRRFAITVLALLGAAATPASAAGDGKIYSFEDRSLDLVTAPILSRFRDDDAFERYIEMLGVIQQGSKDRWVGGNRRELRYAQAQDVPCTPGIDCPETESDIGDVVVTGSRATAPKSITNNQTAGVDEGDIVKQIGPFLLVLRDGRIFSIDTRNGLRLADRVNVYRESDSDTWYDEMLVQGDHVLITAYSYEESATEVSVFRLARDTGRLTGQGVFLISSDDYYDTDNYATRIVGDKLVIYTPYDIDSLEDPDDRPTIRRWLPEDKRDEANKTGENLLNAKDIFRPVLRTSDPAIHTVSICPLGEWSASRDLNCRTTGFVGPSEAEMYVSPDAVFLWMSPGWDETGTYRDCTNHRRPKRADVVPSAIVRLAIESGDVAVAGVNGAPFDQFSMDDFGGNFHALANWQTFRCYPDYQVRHAAFLDLPMSAFGTRFLKVPDHRITAVPSLSNRYVENRFADNWLVYGGRDSWSGSVPDKEDRPLSTTAVAVPVNHPADAIELSLPHNIIRTERVGNDIILNGYRDHRGLKVTLVDLSGDPRLGASLFLKSRYESESRSHAFNSNVDEKGNGLIGIPTVLREGDADRLPWYSDASDISFLSLSRRTKLASVGEIVTRMKEGEQDTHEDYECEVSCIDWYGNARPIFTDGRTFGLIGSELVEAKVEAGSIRELRRLDLTAPLTR
ncbi:beta-propeller domain-containing protein [Sphingomonas sanxanigenens]|uniref:Uncharacterized protein n=1 Tax=Sphingomonas sanxanigenens DSM 19645 = NX02 TaxID=1123269 RepID=W0AG57_9SPHN|nr:beta-propeller domain-containing protein [Sphingomonas sanxanigenens]AHE56899.1 hypothetical protein NX02_26535 [Sphingomonas sanxanigenens DSM 19645 = NX02]